MRNKRFINICKRTQPELKEYLEQCLRDKGYKPIKGDGFLFAPAQDAQVLLTAHMDTVHAEPVREVWQTNDIISSPQGIGGDDRCGIYIILQILRKTKMRPAILFCEDEEIGGVGSNKFVATEHIKKLEKLKFLIELDRMGGNDAVFYECDNPEFTDFITSETGYVETWGSFSDISHLSPACGVASVNLSCGYYNPHNLNEYVDVKKMNNTINVVIHLLERAMENDVPQFEYVEYVYSRTYGSGLFKGDFCEYYFFQWYDRNNGKEMESYYTASSMDEAIGKLCRDNPTVCWNDIYDYYIY